MRRVLRSICGFKIIILPVQITIFYSTGMSTSLSLIVILPAIPILLKTRASIVFLKVKFTNQSDAHTRIHTKIKVNCVPCGLINMNK